MRSVYPRSTFLAIYQAIADKLAQGNPPVNILKSDGGQDTTKLGLKWDPIVDKFEYNAACVILADLKAKKFVDDRSNLNYGKLLYNKRLELEKNPGSESVTIQGEEYNLGLFKFLGFESREAFEEAKGIRVATMPSLVPEAHDNTTPQDGDGYTYYIGAYYSFRNYRIKKFLLAIHYTQQPGQPMPCWQWGFHTTDKKTHNLTSLRKINTLTMTGTAQAKGHHLYINLIEKGGTAGREMHLIGICDEENGTGLPEHQDTIPCALQTVSQDQYAISLEAFLIRCSADEALRMMNEPEIYYGHDIIAESLDAAKKKTMFLYLMLQRRNFKVDFRPNSFNLNDLEYRSNPVRRYTDRLLGEYRIWNFGLRRGIVIQSKLVVSKEIPYQAMFYPYLSDEIKNTDRELEEQLAVLVISNEIRRDQLCFSTFVKRRLTLVNYAIFDIRHLNERNWAEGMFITTGYDEKGIIGGYAVMCKVKPGETCEPMSMTREEAALYAQALGLKDMHDGLRKLWKGKLWKQKSNTQFGCYGIARHPDKGILMVRKSSGPYAGMLDLPGGKLEYGESPENGLKRRFTEETNCAVQDVSLLSNESAVWDWRR
ncbi:MAG: NUDIX domain-containing protein, partial [Saprospiraceae bacterium]|nr:NUDIX domain-containing protein [Saprospiraceae bacterium]